MKAHTALCFGSCRYGYPRQKNAPGVTWRPCRGRRAKATGGEYPGVIMNGTPAKLHAFVMSLSHRPNGYGDLGKNHRSAKLVRVQQQGIPPRAGFRRSSASTTSRPALPREREPGARTGPEILAEVEVMATAILDWLLHRSQVINIKARSYRLKDQEKHIQ